MHGADVVTKNGRPGGRKRKSEKRINLAWKGNVINAHGKGGMGRSRLSEEFAFRSMNNGWTTGWSAARVLEKK